jgi:hypothetical protein
MSTQANEDLKMNAAFTPLVRTLREVPVVVKYITSQQKNDKTMLVVEKREPGENGTTKLVTQRCFVGKSLLSNLKRGEEYTFVLESGETKKKDEKTNKYVIIMYENVIDIFKA